MKMIVTDLGAFFLVLEEIEDAKISLKKRKSQIIMLNLIYLAKKMEFI